MLKRSCITSALEWQKRNILAFVGFLGMALMYCIRFNISLAIVAMTDQNSLHLTQHMNGTSSHDHGICPELLSSNSSTTSINETATLKELDEHTNEDLPVFQWNEKEQGLILGSFFWGYMITQFPGGVLAQRFGAKWVVSSGLLFAGLLSLILPSAAMIGGSTLVMLVRVLQGVGEGVVIPAFTVLLGRWTLPHERASLATLCFSGMPFGTAMTMVISGHLITSFGWPAVFYAPGILTILWFIVWSFLIYSSPQEHPTISKEELSYLEETSIDDADKATSDEEQVSSKIRDIPWRSILTSVPFWAIFVSHFTNTWGHNTLKAEGPKYLHSVLHFNIHENAYIAATPYLCQWIFCNVVTRLSDYMISRKWISVLVSRRLCNTIGQAGTGFAYLCLILADCNRPLAIFCFMLSGMFNGGVYGGMLINPIDISPNYAGVLEGIINAMANISGFGAPFVAGLILHSDHSINGWRYVFLIPVIGDFVGNLVFVLFCSTEVQPWNSPKKEDKAARERTISDIEHTDQSRSQ